MSSNPIVKPEKNLSCSLTFCNEEFEFKNMEFFQEFLTNVLSEIAVHDHSSISFSIRDEAPHPPSKKNEDTHFICETCKKVFARRVTLKKHLKVHEMSSSTIDSEAPNDEVNEMDDVDAIDGVDLLNTENVNDEDNDDN